MTRAFSWAISVSLGSASFCTWYSRYLLISYFSIPVPCDEKGIFFFLVLVQEGHVDLHRTVELQLLWH